MTPYRRAAVIVHLLEINTAFAREYNIIYRKRVMRFDAFDIRYIDTTLLQCPLRARYDGSRHHCKFHACLSESLNTYLD